jgi:hypothetical protein
MSAQRRRDAGVLHFGVVSWAVAGTCMYRASSPAAERSVSDRREVHAFDSRAGLGPRHVGPSGSAVEHPVRDRRRVWTPNSAARFDIRPPLTAHRGATCAEASMPAGPAQPRRPSPRAGRAASGCVDGRRHHIGAGRGDRTPGRLRRRRVRCDKDPRGAAVCHSPRGVMRPCAVWREGGAGRRGRRAEGQTCRRAPRRGEVGIRGFARTSRRGSRGRAHRRIRRGAYGVDTMPAPARPRS